MNRRESAFWNIDALCPVELSSFPADSQMDGACTSFSRSGQKEVNLEGLYAVAHVLRSHCLIRHPFCDEPRRAAGIRVMGSLP